MCKYNCRTNDCKGRKELVRGTTSNSYHAETGACQQNEKLSLSITTDVENRVMGPSVITSVP